LLKQQWTCPAFDQHRIKTDQAGYYSLSELNSSDSYETASVDCIGVNALTPGQRFPSSFLSEIKSKAKRQYGNFRVIRIERLPLGIH
jgi:hypothetical protein